MLHLRIRNAAVENEFKGFSSLFYVGASPLFAIMFLSSPGSAWGYGMPEFHSLEYQIESGAGAPHSKDGSAVTIIGIAGPHIFMLIRG